MECVAYHQVAFRTFHYVTAFNQLVRSTAKKHSTTASQITIFISRCSFSTFLHTTQRQNCASHFSVTAPCAVTDYIACTFLISTEAQRFCSYVQCSSTKSVNFKLKHKFILDSYSFFSVIRNFSHGNVIPSAHFQYYYFDSESNCLMRSDQISRLRSIQSEHFPLQWEFRIKGNSECSSMFIQLGEVNSVLDTPELFFKMNMLPNGFKKKLQNYQNETFRRIGEFRVIRKFININDILLKADEICLKDSESFYEIGFDASDINAAKEKLKKLFDEMELKYSINNTSKYSRFIKPTQQKQ